MGKFNWIGVITGILLANVFAIFLLFWGFTPFYAGFFGGLIAGLANYKEPFFINEEHKSQFGKIAAYVVLVLLILSIFFSCSSNAVQFDRLKLVQLHNGMMGCPDTIIINHSQEWTEHDKAALETAKHNCAQMYPASPCLKEFRKFSDGIYVVLCAQQSHL